MIVRALPYADLLEDADEGLVLYEGRLLRLSALAVAIVTLSTVGVAMDELAAALEERFGLPTSDSALEATTAAVTSLVAQGVVVVEDDAPGKDG